MTITLGQVQELDLKPIIIPTRLRVVKPGAVDAMAKSFEELGQHTPIIVRRNQEETAWVLVVGLTRWRAADKLGWTTIRAIAVECSDDEATLLEIEENLVRADLTKAERTENLRLRKEIWKRQQAETGGTSVSHQPLKDGRKAGPQHQKGFAAEMAAKTGKSKRTINRNLAGIKAKPKPRKAKSEKVKDLVVSVEEPQRKISEARQMVEAILVLAAKNGHGDELAAEVLPIEIGSVLKSFKRVRELIDNTMDALGQRFPDGLYRDGEKVPPTTH